VAFSPGQPSDRTYRVISVRADCAYPVNHLTGKYPSASCAEGIRVRTYKNDFGRSAADERCGNCEFSVLPARIQNQASRSLTSTASTRIRVARRRHCSPVTTVQYNRSNKI